MNEDNLNSKDSLKKRYFSKLFANFFGMAMGLVTAGIVPRGLGPKVYGDFNFLSNFFNQVVSFLDMGTSTAFYTKLSQRQREFGLTCFYFYFMGIIFLIVMSSVILAFFASLQDRLWPDQKMFYIYLGAGFGIALWVVQVLNNTADAYGLTVPAEWSKVIQKALGVTVILFLYVFHRLNLGTYFYSQYLILSFLGGAFIWIMKRNGYFTKESWKLTGEQIKKYVQEFYQYSHPLFTYALVGMIVGILDRWLLQIFAGSVQQGFFGFSYHIGAIYFLFTSAMTPLLIREFSIASGNKDFTQMATLFRRYIPLLYSITAYFACFVALQSEKVIHIMAGKSYKEAVTVVTIMAFYPVHQTYGQLSSSVFLATGQTKLYRDTGIIMMLIGLPITYFLIAPKQQWGIGAGATGLAIKMVLIQFIWVNVHLYFNAKLLKLSFWRYVGHQIFSVGCLLALAAVATFGVDRILGPNKSIILSFLLSGVVYTLMVINLVYYLPAVFGTRAQDIRSIIENVKNIF